jgi:hypothetical protein
MWSDMRMSREDITLTVFSEVCRDMILYIFDSRHPRLIGELDLISREKCSDRIGRSMDEVDKSLSIHRVEKCLLRKAPIPEIEIFPSCLTIADFFEESISLTHDSLIVTLHLRKLSEGPSEDPIDIVAPDRWSEVEEIHIERREKYRPIWQTLTILHSAHFRSLDTILFLPHMSPHTIGLRADISYVSELESKGLISGCVEVVERASTREMDRFEDMSLA